MQFDKQLLDKFTMEKSDKFVGIASDEADENPRVYCNTFTLQQATVLGQRFEVIRIYFSQPNDKFATWKLVYDSKEEIGDERRFRRNYLMGKRRTGPRKYS